MSNAQSSSARKWFRDWLAERSDELEINGTVGEIKESEFGSSSVRIETNKYIIDITVWDHNSALEIGALNIDSKEDTFLHTDACTSKKYFLNELTKFEDWYREKHETGN